MFGHTKRMDEGNLKEVLERITSYREFLKQSIHNKPEQCYQYTRLDVWARGFHSALNELEQSLFVCATIHLKINKSYVEDMNEGERDEYDRYVYFYKNAIIRVFSLLDKMGFFLNDYFGIHTEQVKQQFSYFTVLREMDKKAIAPILFGQLLALKIKDQQPLGRLRKERNMEIHHINIEMADELTEAHLCSPERVRIQDTQEELEDLRRGYENVCAVIRIVFTYASKHFKS